MGKFKRFVYIIQGMLMLLSTFILLLIPDETYILIIAFLSIYLLIYSINQFIYYFTLAKYMVGGKIILCKAFVVMNLAVEIQYLSSLPEYYVMIFLVTGLIFASLVDILRSFEIKKNHGVGWKIKLSQGILIMIISVVGILFAVSTTVVVYIFCLGLVSAAITKFAEAFRRTAVVYIQ